jgi:hypothetical protein
MELRNHEGHERHKGCFTEGNKGNEELKAFLCCLCTSCSKLPWSSRLFFVLFVNFVVGSIAGARIRWNEWQAGSLPYAEERQAQQRLK